MTIREQIEKREQEILSPFACLSINSRGRDYDEPQCDIRPVFQRDRDRILHSKAFRRLKNKTQVFLTPKGDHYRTRMSHTLEVSQIARTIARALRLNEDLTEAISLGHDLGHTPFGHAGERALNELAPFPFHHAQQSVREVERLVRLANQRQEEPEEAPAPDQKTVYMKDLETRLMQQMGVNIHDIHAGRANMFLSPTFREALASTSGATIELYETDGSIGAAKGAGMGCGLYHDHTEAFDSLRQLDIITPDEEKRPQYAEAYAEWKDILEKIIRQSKQQ